MKDIDRQTVAKIVLDQARDMIEKELPGSTDNDAGRAVLIRLEQSAGFQALVTQQVAELEARMKGQVH
jgi:hypothetical protein